MTVALSYVKQQAANAFIRFKRMTKENDSIFKSILGEGLTKEINGDRGSIWWAPWQVFWSFVQQVFFASSICLAWGQSLDEKTLVKTWLLKGSNSVHKTANQGWRRLNQPCGLAYTFLSLLIRWTRCCDCLCRHWWMRDSRLRGGGWVYQHTGKFQMRLWIRIWEKWHTRLRW